jgi:glucose/arabinose dehydrogenase
MNIRTATVSILSALAWAVSASGQSSVRLPAPYHTPSATNAPKVVPQPDGARLQVPQGFHVEQFSSGFQKPRIMLLAPGGEVLVADSAPKGGVFVVVDKNKDGKADSDPKPLIQGLDRPYGMAWWKNYLYVAEPTSLKRYRFDAKNLSAGSAEELITFPESFGKGHWTRSITFDPKGEKLYLEIGSGSNASPDDDERRATVLECTPEAKNCTIFASGLRNATTIAFRPGTTELWASVQERDGLGDDLVPDYFARVQRGGFYGWPWAYYGPNEDPRNAGKRPDLVKKTVVPDVNLGAHTAVIDWKFYTGKQFPAKYRGGAFFALRGSSNRSKRVGYSVVFLPFDRSGKPAAAQPEDFLTGWMVSPDAREVWGRPTGILEMRDGSLLVSEDGGNRIWRISYKN